MLWLQMPKGLRQETFSVSFHLLSDSLLQTFEVVELRMILSESKFHLGKHAELLHYELEFFYHKYH